MSDELRRTHFPYCFKQQDNGKYIILNRLYKPLGFCTHDHVVYEDYPIEFKTIRLTKSQIQKLTKNTVDEFIFLYDDTCVPTHIKSKMDVYLEKLRILSQVKVERINW